MFIVLVIVVSMVTMVPAVSADIISVPAEVATLQSAITQAQEGDVIELATGTYDSPSGDGFQIFDRNRSFTIRAAFGASVTLSGGGTRRILKMRNNGAGDYSVLFENLTFADGFNSTNGSAGGVTIENGRATFVNCDFENNTSQASSTGGGAVIVTQGSTVHFFNSRFTGNTAKNEGGGLRVALGSTAHVHDSEFTGNRVDLPNHRNSAAGGGIHMTNSVLTIADSRFTGNAAGCVGGAVYGLGTWAEPLSTPAAELTIVNSTFENNLVEPDPTVTCVFSPVGGAVHTEDHLTTKIYNSRFRTNQSDIGGAVSQYRTILEIYDSIFQGNRAKGAGDANFGGAISVNSNDSNDATTGNGTINRRSASLTIRDSLFQARYGAVTDGGLEGGCLFALGDVNRTFGIGVSQMGSAASNRAVIDIQRTIFADCDVVEEAGVVGTGVGGAMAVDLVDLTLTDSLLIDNDAFGSGFNGSGGAIKMGISSEVTISRTTFANNTAFSRGGAIQLSGSHLDADNNIFFDNEVTNGTGSVVWSAPFPGFFGVDLPVSGVIRDNIFSNNVSRELAEIDRAEGPINALVYNGNDIFTTNSTVYSNTLEGTHGVASFNGVVVNRDPGVGDTDKSTLANSSLGTQPEVATLVGAPSEILLTHAVNDPPSSGQSYLGYAWSGPAGTDGRLFGSPLPDGTGLEMAGSGVHTLEAGSASDTATLDNAAIPTAALIASPEMISAGGSSNLIWSTQGTLLDLSLDHGVAIGTSSSGSVSVTPGGTSTYRLCAITREGGAFDEATVYVDEFPTAIFSDGFESGGLTPWSAVVP